MTSDQFILPSHKTPIEFIMDIVTAHIINASISFEKLKGYTDKGDSYIRSGIATSKLLGLITENEQGLNVNQFCIDNLGKIPNDETKKYVFRKFLQEWEPFILFIQYCINGEDMLLAARKVFAVFPFQNKDYKFLLDLFITWGSYTGIFNYHKMRGIELNDTIVENKSQLTKIDIDLDLDMSNRLYILETIGEVAFNFLDHDEIQELVAALGKYSVDPRGAIECSARAFEDFLRRISTQVDLSKTNGIGQIVNKLYNNRDSQGVLNNIIHSKQFSIANAIGDIRNMAGHSKEARTLERWDLSINASKAFIHITLVTIRSIYDYINNDKFVF